MKIESVHVVYIIVPCIILVVAFVLSRIVRFFMNRYVHKASESLHVDPTKYSFFKNAANFIIYTLAIIAVFYTIPGLRDYGVTLFAGAGVFAAIVGFASQSAFSNIISGIFIVIFKPFSVGHIIKVGESYFGQVEDITLRHTIIKSFENRRIVIPNSVISDQTIENSSIVEEAVCMFIVMGISYDSDIDLAIKIIQEEAMKHPSALDLRTEEDKNNGQPMVIVRLVSFGDSSVNLRAQVWASEATVGFVMKCDLHKSIKERFDQEGIEIPFPYRTIVYKNKEEK